MNKRQVISSLNNIAEELDNNGLYVEASTITNVMKKVAQMEAQPDTRRDILKMLSVNLNNVYSDLLTGNPVNQSHIDQAIAAKSNFAQLSSILTSLLGKKI
jgi:hypothetical protein